uniref:Uncharacterized protein n=1 Tax=Cyanothece sp. (strain PCC 7425 / ATCC 29141) TaxID=395961 RepID=B8HT01_CYAP4
MTGKVPLASSGLNSTNALVAAHALKGQIFQELLSSTQQADEAYAQLLLSSQGQDLIAKAGRMSIC